MVTLNAGNVLLKPSHRRQLMAWLKRATKLGQRVGDFAVSISLHRRGRQTEVWAQVTDRAGQFDCRSRQNDWRDAVREVIRDLSLRLADQRNRLSLA